MFARQLAIFCVFAIGWDCSEHCIAINIHINLISWVNLRQASGFSLLQLQNGAAVLLAKLSTSMNLSIRLIASLCLSLAFAAFRKLFRWEAISEVQDGCGQKSVWLFFMSVLSAEFPLTKPKSLDLCLSTFKVSHRDPQARFNND